MYSQRNEEEVILRIFPEGVGHFLDIGAYDGKTFSNTRALAERGWSGVLVEASPTCFVQLAKNFEGFDKVVLVNALIGIGSGLKPFWNTPDAVGTTEHQHYEKWKSAALFQQIYLNELSVADLLRFFPSPFQFISIDTEGTTKNILYALDIPKLSPRLVCVEFDDNLVELTNYFLSVGYEVIHQTEENILARKK